MGEERVRPGPTHNGIGVTPGGHILQGRHDQVPADTPFMSTGTLGRHSEHMGFILAEMQSLQRQHPGGHW